MNMTDHDMISDEYERLIRVEEQVATIRTIARLAWSLVIVMLVQTGGFIYAYAQLSHEVENLNLADIERNVTTALTVLGQHGTEFTDVRSDISAVRNEHSRLRGNIDDVHNQLVEFRNALDARTQDRFYRADGDKLERRIQRVEEELFFNGK